MAERPASDVALLARLIGGEVIGDPTVAIAGAAPLGEVAAGQITFVEQPERLAQATASPAAALVLPRGLECPGKSVIAVDDVHAAFSRIVLHFNPRRETKRDGISPHAVISPSAVIGRDVAIGAGAIIGDHVVIGDGSTLHAGVTVMAGCQLGERVTLFPRVTLYEETRVGDRTIIHAGAVIGAYGFGYRQPAGRHELTAQLGHVEIGSDVEIGANSTIDRGTYGATRIGNGTKIDNLVQIGHNCQIGQHNLLCAQVGIAGSTSTGDYVVMAGQVGVRDHVHVGRGARIGAMAGVANDIPEGISAFGAPAIPERDQKVLIASLAKLPQMRKEFKQVAKTVQQLAERAGLDNPGDRALDPAA
jgi:UDP-3-O-[3-hydroxymyristoyl] glucosamine N-acyltransferase